VNLVWEAVHDRVTANILNLFKRECEMRFLRVRSGETPLHPKPLPVAPEPGAATAPPRAPTSV
jgi:hypothetical protein